MIIPLNAYPNQDLTVMLGNQKCHMVIKQKSTGMYMDITVDDIVLVVGQLVVNRVPTLFSDYRGFRGVLVFRDSRGNNNPDYREFNDRYTLNYEN